MKLKLAVIGTGMAWEQLHWPAIQQLADRYEVIAVCNKSIEKAQNFANLIQLPQDCVYSDYREMLKRTDIDVVDLLVPISENYEVARDVLMAGKNLIAEKPFAATLSGAKELIDLKNEHQCKVMVAENYRYEECYTFIKAIIEEKQIGEITHFILNTGAGFEKEMTENNFSAKEWRQHPDFEGGIFLDGGIHDIAMMRFLFGDVETVKAFARKHDKEYCPYHNINTLIKFRNGVIGNYTYCSSSADLQKPPVGLRIYGEDGDLYLESKKSGMIYINYKNGMIQNRPFAPGKGYYNEFLNYAEGNIVSTPEKEIGDMELVFTILENIDS